jgi:hypothetical protein
MIGVAIIRELLCVYFDISIKMSRELRTYGCNLDEEDERMVLNPFEKLHEEERTIVLVILHHGRMEEIVTNYLTEEPVFLGSVSFNPHRRLPPDYARSDGKGREASIQAMKCIVNLQSDPLEDAPDHSRQG